MSRVYCQWKCVLTILLFSIGTARGGGRGGLSGRAAAVLHKQKKVSEKRQYQLHTKLQEHRREAMTQKLLSDVSAWLCMTCREGWVGGGRAAAQEERDQRLKM